MFLLDIGEENRGLWLEDFVRLCHFIGKSSRSARDWSSRRRNQCPQLEQQTSCFSSSWTMDSWEDAVRRFMLEEEEEDDELFLVMVPAVQMPEHTSSLPGAKKVKEILEGHPNWCKLEFRMEPEIFRAIADFLRVENLNASNYFLALLSFALFCSALALFCSGLNYFLIFVDLSCRSLKVKNF